MLRKHDVVQTTISDTSFLSHNFNFKTQELLIYSEHYQSTFIVLIKNGKKNTEVILFWALTYS